jgi:hypothetical protein
MPYKDSKLGQQRAKERYVSKTGRELGISLWGSRISKEDAEYFGLCRRCRRTKALPGKRMCEFCAEYESKSAKECRARNPEKYLESNRRSRARYSKKYKAKGKIKYLELKAQVFAHYGAFCACCGETEPLFLTVDHVNNDGAKDREKNGSASGAFYDRIIKEGFPNTYQILCRNCNWGKHRNGGICPHQTDKATL